MDIIYLRNILENSVLMYISNEDYVDDERVINRVYIKDDVLYWERELEDSGFDYDVASTDEINKALFDLKIGLERAGYDCKLEDL